MDEGLRIAKAMTGLRPKVPANLECGAKRRFGLMKSSKNGTKKRGLVHIFSAFATNREDSFLENAYLVRKLDANGH